MPVPGSREQVEILRDRWGVAHVYAEQEAAGFYGLGYASAQDRMFQMMIRRRSAQGRIAEILGPGTDNRFLDADRRARASGSPVAPGRSWRRWQPTPAPIWRPTPLA